MSGHADVVHMCRKGELPLQCARLVIVSVEGFIVAVLSGYLIVRITRNTEIKNSSFQLVILWLAVIECVILLVHWLFVSPAPQLAFFLTYIKVVMMFIITFHFMKFALGLFKLAHLTRRVLWPAFVVCMLALTAVFILACTGAVDHELDCLAWSWALMSGFGFVASTLLTAVSWPVSRRISEKCISRFDGRDINRKRRKLWILMVIYFTSSVLSFVWDLYSAGVFKKDAPGTCKHYLTMTEFFFVYIIVWNFMMLLPLWGVLYQFWDTGRIARLPASTEKSPLTSTHLTPANSSSRAASPGPVFYSAVPRAPSTSINEPGSPAVAAVAALQQPPQSPPQDSQQR